MDADFVGPQEEELKIDLSWKLLVDGADRVTTLPVLCAPDIRDELDVKKMEAASKIASPVASCGSWTSAAAEAKVG